MTSIRSRVWAAILVLCATGVWAAPAEALPSPCSVSISVPTTSYEAEVTSSSAVAITIEGNYTAQKPAAERAVLTLSASIDPAWATAVSPATVIISGSVGGAGAFTVTVVVPPGTLTTQVGVVGIAAAMTAGGISCQGDSVDGITIAPLPYFESLSAAVEPREVATRNGAGSFSLVIGATANVAVTASLSISGPAGSSFQAPATVSLPKPTGGPVNTSVTVHVSAANLAAGAYPLIVVVHATTSEGLSQQSQVQANLTLVEQPFDVASGPWLPLGAVAAVAVGVAVWWRRR